MLSRLDKLRSAGAATRWRRRKTLRLAAVWLVAVGAAPAAITSLAIAGAYPSDAHRRSDAPHPAVARIVVPENGATSYGSGVLVDVRDDYGLVITNWHVVRDAAGTVEVIMPGGFTSKARPLKVDPDWDLAALVIWRPPMPPVALASRAPQPGDELTICGYGPGIYRAATGRCTQYYSPRQDLPQHMVELDVEARQGDSGGPIFNDRGELAGVLFGAGQGTTLGSFGGRVENFMASLAPDIGRSSGEPAVRQPPFALAATRAADSAAAQTAAVASANEPRSPSAKLQGAESLAARLDEQPGDATDFAAAPQGAPAAAGAYPAPAFSDAATEQAVSAPSRMSNSLDFVKSALAAIGVIAIVVQLLKLVR
ncbi:MAG: trypsin-like peptidase domain-containing protein [Planctomycetales bacterium]|nr:trypsin-like peptidase domain-containing protein [Planctomycetales bacterium]